MSEIHLLSVQQHGMWCVAEWRQVVVGVVLVGLGFVAFPVAASSSHNKQADALFAQTGFLEIQIDIGPDETAVLQNYKRRPASWERNNVLCTVREGGVIYSNVAIHLKGSAGSFRPFDGKPALTLTFDKHDSDQRFHGLSKISLNNSVQDSSYLCEKIGRGLFNAAGVPVPRATHATVEMNGRYLGLFVLIEGWTKQFLKRHFDDVSGNLYERSVGNDLTDLYEVKSGDAPDDRMMLDLLAAATQEQTADRLAELDRVLDLDRFITFMAMEVMLGHWDGYCLNRNNYRIFHDRSRDKLVFMPHGMDQLFGIRRSASDSSVVPQMRGMVAAAVMQTPKGRQRYISRMSELLTNVFHAEAISNHAAQVAASLRPAFANNLVPLEPNARRGRRFADFPNGISAFDTAVTNFQRQMTGRAASVAQQLQQFTSPVQFGSSRVIDLANWEWQRDYGTVGPPRRSVINGDETLEINITGVPSRASWRTQLLLSEGKYQFHGLVRLERLPRPRTNASDAICLRTSEGSVSLAVTNAPYWIALTNNFTLTTPKYVELVCEYSGSRGRAQFDLSTLKLRRFSEKVESLNR